MGFNRFSLIPMDCWKNCYNSIDLKKYMTNFVLLHNVYSYPPQSLTKFVTLQFTHPYTPEASSDLRTAPCLFM